MPAEADRSRIEFSDYLGRLKRLAESGQTSIQKNPPADPARARDQIEWWEGYIRAIEDVMDAYYGDR